MHFLPGFLSWLSGHCWGCRLGAKWRQRSEPQLANPVFLTPSFLWFAISLSVVDVATIGLFYAAPQSGVVAVAVLCAVGGLATGLFQGRETYSSF
jgi:hypothetical protein